MPCVTRSLLPEWQPLLYSKLELSTVIAGEGAMKSPCHQMHGLLVAREQFQAGRRCFLRNRQMGGRKSPNRGA